MVTQHIKNIQKLTTAAFNLSDLSVAIFTVVSLHRFSSAFSGSNF